MPLGISVSTLFSLPNSISGSLCRQVASICPKSYCLCGGRRIYFSGVVIRRSRRNKRSFFRTRGSLCRALGSWWKGRLFLWACFSIFFLCFTLDLAFIDMGFDLCLSAGIWVAVGVQPEGRFKLQAQNPTQFSCLLSNPCFSITGH